MLTVLCDIAKEITACLRFSVISQRRLRHAYASLSYRKEDNSILTLLCDIANTKLIPKAIFPWLEQSKQPIKIVEKALDIFAVSRKITVYEKCKSTTAVTQRSLRKVDTVQHGILPETNDKQQERDLSNLQQNAYTLHYTLLPVEKDHIFSYQHTLKPSADCNTTPRVQTNFPNTTQSSSNMLHVFSLLWYEKVKNIEH